ncbi:hypothetical protein SUGI_0388390 [Cryptomeria japonica]|nr:hypothetical protein SUGI_0388390 [Cryptomeria japonica]
MRSLLEAASPAYAPSSFTKRQIKAIVLYVSVAALIAVCIYIWICYGRRRKKAKLHDLSVADTASGREPDSD